MAGEFDAVPVKDFALHNIRPKVKCRNCGRERVIEGGLLQRSFSAETRLHAYQLNQFAKRFVCGNCGAHWPTIALGKW